MKTDDEKSPLQRFIEAGPLDTNEAFAAGVESCFVALDDMGEALELRQRLAAKLGLRLTTARTKALRLGGVA